ncbi:MAG TPA: DUF503 domain-containing protein [bacterium]
MLIGVLKITLLLRNSHSLKDKRRIIKSLMEKMKQIFNISVSEVEHRDMWQKVTLGVSFIGRNSSYISTVNNSIMEFIDTCRECEVINDNRETIAINDFVGEMS